MKRRLGNAQLTESTLSIFITILLIPQTYWPYEPLQHDSIIDLSADREKAKSWDVYDLRLLNLQSNSEHKTEGVSLSLSHTGTFLSWRDFIVGSYRWRPEFALLNTMIKQDELLPD